MLGERLGSLAAFRPMAAVEGLDAMLLAIGAHRFDLGVGVGDEVIDGDGDRHAELLHVLDMAAEIGETLLERLDILLLEIVLADAAMHLERAHRGDDDRRRRMKAGLAAFDVEEFLRTEIGAEARFGHDVIGELEGGLRRHHRIAAMGDIGEGAAMHEGRIVLERLHEIGHQRVFQAAPSWRRGL